MDKQSKSKKSQTPNQHHCYILHTRYKKHCRRTYNGYTNNLKKRIRQHNKELVGGARYTGRFGNSQWEYLAVVSGFPCAQNALQCEWRIKHPTGKRRRPSVYNCPVGRLKGLAEVLLLSKWTNQSEYDNASLDLEVYVPGQFHHLFANIPLNIKLKNIDSLFKEVPCQ